MLANSVVDRFAKLGRPKMLQQLPGLVVFIGRRGTLCTGLNMRRDQPGVVFFQVATNVERQQFLDVLTIHECPRLDQSKTVHEVTRKDTREYFLLVAEISWIIVSVKTVVKK